MNCDSSRRLISDYVDGLLPEADMPSFGTHVQGCRFCRLELAAERRADDELSRQEFEGLSDDFTARVLVRYRQERHSAASLKWSALTNAGYGLSASTLVAVFVHYLKTSRAFEPNWAAVDEQTSKVGAVMASPTGVESSLVLSVAVLMALTWGLYTYLSEGPLGYSR